MKTYDGRIWLSLGEFQRLGRAFLGVADLRMDEDRNINEWLKQQIASKQAVADLRAKHGYDEWGAKAK